MFDRADSLAPVDHPPHASGPGPQGSARPGCCHLGTSTLESARAGIEPSAADERSGYATAENVGGAAQVAGGVRVPGCPPTCSRESHEDLKDLVRSWLEFRNNWPEQLPQWLDSLTRDDQRRLGGWLATRRPWPGTPLLLGECADCHSSLSVCGDCRDEGVVERGNGPGAYEEACDCLYGEREAVAQ